MNYLFSTKTNDNETIFFRIQTSIPSLTYTIRVKIALTLNNNTTVSILKDNEWKHMFEDSYRETAGNNQHRNAKIEEYARYLYLLLCER